MNIVPKGAPAPSAPATDHRAAAIAAFNAGSAQNASENTGLNQNNISPEEMGAVKPRQPDTIEAPATEAVADAPAQAAATPEATPAKPAEEPISQQYAVLARKEKQLRAKAQAQEQAYKAREDAIKAREEALIAKDAEYATKYVPKDRLKQNTWDVLAENEISYDQVTEQALTAQNTDPRVLAHIRRLEAKLEETAKESKAANEAQAKTYADSQKQAYDNAVKQIHTNVTKLVDKDEAYEMIKATNSTKDVVDLIEKTYKEDGVLLTEDEAAQQVEEYLTEEAYKLANLKKIQKRLQTPGASNPSSTTGKSPDAPKQTQPMKTLTNAVGTSRQLTSKERAILAFKGEKS